MIASKFSKYRYAITLSFLLLILVQSGNAQVLFQVTHWHSNITSSPSTRYPATEF